MKPNQDKDPKEEELLEKLFAAEPDQQMKDITDKVEAGMLNINYDTTSSIWKEQRIKAVALELMSGYTPSQIADKYADKFEVKRSNILRTYVPAARRLLATEILTKESDIRVDLLAKYNYLFQLNFERGDLVECRKVADSITKLTQTLTSNINLTANLKTIELVQVLSEGKIIDIEANE